MSQWRLTTRLLWQWLALLAFASVAAFWGSSTLLRSTLQQSQDNDLRSVGQVILDSVVRVGDGIDVDLPYDAFDVLAFSAPERLYFAVLLDGKTLAGYPEIVEVLGSITPGARTEPFLGGDVRWLIVEKRVAGVQRVQVVMGQSQDSLNQEAQSIGWIIAGSVVFFFVLAALVGAGSLRAAIRPLRLIQRELSTRAPNDFRPVSTDAPREIDALVASLNRTMSSHQQLLADSQELITKATHQIKTPIAALTLQAEQLQSNAQNNPLNEAIRALNVRARHASRLVSQLLRHAGLTYRSPQALFEPVDLNPLLQSIVRTLSVNAESKEIAIEYQCISNATVPADIIALREAIICLLDNAIEHSPALAEVRLTLERHTHAAVVVLTNTGSQFPEPTNQLTEAFTKGSNGHTGAGLGLTIAHDVIRRHGGELTLTNTAAGEAQCHISLPFG